MPSSVSPTATTTRSSSRSGRKQRTCADCFFDQNNLCALDVKQPCPTFRPAHPEGLRPPRQLSFVFRQDRRPQAMATGPSSLPDSLPD